MEILLTEGEEPCLPPSARPVVAAIGVFDGVHRGHQRVILHTVAGARSLGGIAAVYTFFPQPSSVLEGVPTKALLFSPKTKYACIAALGVDVLIAQRFDRPFSRLTEGDFLKLLRKKIPTLRGLCVGEDFRFGRARSGDTRSLGLRAPEMGLETHVLPSLCSPDDRRISSTRIRQAVSGGRMELARDLLGRPYALEGTLQVEAKSPCAPELRLDREPGLRPCGGLYYVRYRTQGAQDFASQSGEGVLYYPGRDAGEPGVPCRIFPLRETAFSSGDAVRIHCLHFSGEPGSGAPEDGLRAAREYFLQKKNDFPWGSISKKS